ncbi:ACT domain-containing protein [bacterium]|nr:ACT domain-containing protein [bacterium]
MKRTLQEIPGVYSVVCLGPQAPLPSWIPSDGFVSITRTDEELSIVCMSSAVPAGDFSRENGWKCLKVVGPLDFALTGILSSIATPLAEAKISIFAISTFDTDYILIRQESFVQAQAVLRKAGFGI